MNTETCSYFAFGFATLTIGAGIGCAGGAGLHNLIYRTTAAESFNSWFALGGGVLGLTAAALAIYYVFLKAAESSEIPYDIEADYNAWDTARRNAIPV